VIGDGFGAFLHGTDGKWYVWRSCWARRWASNSSEPQVDRTLA